MQQKRAPLTHFNDILPNVTAALSQTSPHCSFALLLHHPMAARARSGTLVAPGAPAKLQPRKGKDGFVADNVFAISSVVPEDVRLGVEAFEALDTKPFRRCLQIASRIASGDAIDERLLSETGDFFLSCTHEIVLCCVLRIALLVVARLRTCARTRPRHPLFRRFRRVHANSRHCSCFDHCSHIPQVYVSPHAHRFTPNFAKFFAFYAFL